MPTIRDFGIPGLTPGYLQPKLKNKWRVTFAKLGQNAAQAPTGNSQDVSMQAVTFSRPQLTFTEVNLHRYVTRAWIAGKYDWAAASLSVEDDITSRASRVIQAQLTLQQQIIGANEPWVTTSPSFLATAPEAADYKFITICTMLDGGVRPLEEWYLEGCWFQDVNWTDLATDSSDAVKIDMKIRFDHARQIIYNYDSPGKGSALSGDSPNATPTLPTITISA